MGKLRLRTGASALVFLLSAAFAFAQTTPAPKRIVFLGDSLTAGYGVGEEKAFPALVAEKIRAADLPYEVINAGLSGDTSSGGLRRLDWLLQKPIDVLVLALGANDGLRGLSPEVMQKNLEAIITKTRAKNPQVQIVLAGMRMPPNMGGGYAEKFKSVFATVAQQSHVTFLPFLLEGVGGHRDLNQADQIHPNAAGHEIIASALWKTLEPLLRQPSAS